MPAKWPSWWSWDLEFTPHIERRMIDRGFNEVDLRLMLQRASSCRRDVVDGRWVVDTQHSSRSWEVIVEPDEEDRVLVLVTAYPVER